MRDIDLRCSGKKARQDLSPAAIFTQTKDMYANRQSVRVTQLPGLTCVYKNCFWYYGKVVSSVCFQSECAGTYV